MMQRVLDGWHSPSLNKHMEIVAYGEHGFPLLLFPTAAADYLEYERFYVIEVIREFIEAGKLKVFSINSINREGWMAKWMHPHDRVHRQVQYNQYITDEVVPYIRNHSEEQTGIITAGASLGAYHAANQLFRRPELFDGMIAMSGNYNIRNFTDGYYDDDLYFNDPLAYLPNLNDDHYLPMLRQKKHIHVLSGQGAYENPDGSRQLAGILTSKGIPHNLDLWGYDMPHDWPTWRAMMKYYIGERF
jgi:esterase/lipase superfamily enzyme